MKQHPSAFTDTDLEKHLEKLGKKKIVLAGMYGLWVVATIGRLVNRI